MAGAPSTSLVWSGYASASQWPVTRVASSVEVTVVVALLVKEVIHPRRRNVTTSMVGLRNGHIHRNLIKNGEPQRYSWGTQKKKKEEEEVIVVVVLVTL